MKTGIELIAEERQEQIEKHGFTARMDREYKEGELKSAAMFVLTEDMKHYPKSWESWFFDNIRSKGGGKESDIEKLAIAGALIAAEIDRLQNLKSNS